MKNLGLLFSFIFATSSVLAYVAEFDKKSVYMAVKLENCRGPIEYR